MKLGISAVPWLPWHEALCYAAERLGFDVVWGKGVPSVGAPKGVDAWVLSAKPGVIEGLLDHFAEARREESSPWLVALLMPPGGQGLANELLDSGACDQAYVQLGGMTSADLLRQVRGLCRKSSGRRANPEYVRLRTDKVLVDRAAKELWDVSGEKAVLLSRRRSTCDIVAALMVQPERRFKRGEFGYKVREDVSTKACWVSARKALGLSLYHHLVKLDPRAHTVGLNPDCVVRPVSAGDMLVLAGKGEGR